MSYGEKLGSLARLFDPVNNGQSFILDLQGEPVLFDAYGAINTAVAGEVTNRNAAIAAAITQEIADRNSKVNSSIALEVTDRNAAIAQEVFSLNASITATLNSANAYTDTKVAAISVAGAVGSYSMTSAINVGIPVIGNNIAHDSLPGTWQIMGFTPMSAGNITDFNVLVLRIA